MALTTAAALSLLLAGASALPAKGSTQQGGFTVNQVKSAGGAARIGAVAHRNVRLKYGAAVPNWLDLAATNALQSAAANAGSGGGQTGSATTTPQANDEAYLTPVTIGGKTLNLDFDTGSSDLWTFSSLLPASELAGHDYFDVSTGTLLPGETWSISYVDLSGASGTVYQASATVGGVTATKQAIEAATSVSSSFQQNTDSDGLLGLAFSSINTVTPDRQLTFFDNVKGQLASPIFAARLRKGQPGKYDFGFADSSAYKGALTYTPVNNASGFWQIAVTGYAVGTGAIQSSNINVVADTGSTLMFLPTLDVLSYYSAVSGASLDLLQGGYTFPCTSTLPSLSVVIGGKTFTIPGSYLNYEQIPGSSKCFGGLQDGSGLPSLIFGDIFLKAHYAVFDSNGPRFGLATQADVNATPSGSPNGGGGLFGGIFGGLFGGN